MVMFDDVLSVALVHYFACELSLLWIGVVLKQDLLQNPEIPLQDPDVWSYAIIGIL